jgi:hypothetical protein
MTTLNRSKCASRQTEAAFTQEEEEDETEEMKAEFGSLQ